MADIKFPTEIPNGTIATGDKILFSDTSDSNATKDDFIENLPISTATQNALNLKADKSTTINGYSLNSNITLSSSDVGAPSGSGSSTGTNTGDNATNTTSNAYADGKVSDAGYNSTTWDSVTTIAPSKNAVRDKFVSVDTSIAQKVTNNPNIAPGTHTKITYDTKGLVTSGADATTADISDSTNKRYVTDSQLTVIGNTSGVNTGDQVLPTKTSDLTNDSVVSSIVAGTNITIDITDPRNPVISSSGGGGGGGKLMYDAIVATSGGDYTTLGAAITAGKKTIFVRKGTYAETSTITLSIDGVTIIGESKKDTIIQFAAGIDGLAQYANNCYVTNLTLDGETNNSSAVYIIGDGKTPGSEDLNIGINNVVDNCIIKGPNDTFAIYIAGPAYSVGNATLTGFQNNGLHTGNIVRNCELHSSWSGDSFSFSMQKNGAFDNNICYGGRIAFYMCRDSSCSYNKIVSSANQGIFFAGPAYDNVLNGNTIYSPTSSGIKLQNQLEHTPLLAGQGIIGNTISNNTIRSAGVNGIEISGESSNPVIGNTIVGNSINGAVDHCVYLQYAEKNTIKGNILKNPKSAGGGGRGSGIYMVANVIDNTFEGNSIDGTSYHTAISNREDNSCVGNIVKGNKIKGTNTERTIWFESDETIIEGNSIEGGNYAGIRLNNASYCQVLGNKLKNNTNDANNAYAEIWLQGSSSYNIISNNTTRSTATNKAANGINIDGASCVANVVTKNKITGNLSSSVVDTGTSSETYLQNINQQLTTTSSISANSIKLSASPTVTGTVVGELYMNTAEGGLPEIRINANTSLTVGAEFYAQVVNKTGSTLTDGSVVYVSGAQGNRPTATLAQANTAPTSKVIGVVTADILNNTEGFVTILGDVHSYNTSGFTAGDTLYLSATVAGGLTNTAPSSPNYVVEVAKALNATNNGTISVRPQNVLAGDVALGTDNTIAPTQNAIKTYVDTLVAGDQYLHGIESWTAPTWSDATKVLTIPACTYWYQRTKKVCSANTTIDLTTAIGAGGANKIYYVYFPDASGTPTVSTTAWTLSTNVPIVTVYWNGATGAIGLENHGPRRDIAWHTWAHLTIGARYQSGLAIGAFGGSGTGVTWSFTGGTIYDEDIRIDIGATNQTSPGARVWYPTSASTATFVDTAYPFIWNSGTSRVRYPNASYTLTDLGTTSFINIFAYGTNDKDRPIYFYTPNIAAAYTTAANARAASTPDLSALGLSPEWKLLYRMVVNGTGAFSTTVTGDDYRLSSTLPGGGTSVPSASGVTYTPSGALTSTNVQGAIDQLETNKALPTFTAWQDGQIVVGQIAQYIVPYAMTIRGVYASLGSLPTGSNVTIQCYRNGTSATNSIFTSDTPITIATNTGATNGQYSVSSTTIDNGTCAAGDVLYFFVTAVGSTLPGSDLFIQTW